jgi:hypothetical protein
MGADHCATGLHRLSQLDDGSSRPAPQPSTPRYIRAHHGAAQLQRGTGRDSVPRPMLLSPSSSSDVGYLRMCMCARVCACASMSVSECVCVCACEAACRPSHCPSIWPPLTPPPSTKWFPPLQAHKCVRGCSAMRKYACA